MRSPSRLAPRWDDSRLNRTSKTTGIAVLAIVFALSWIPNPPAGDVASHHRGASSPSTMRFDGEHAIDWRVLPTHDTTPWLASGGTLHGRTTGDRSELVLVRTVADFELRLFARVERGEASIVHRASLLTDRTVGFVHRIGAETSTLGTIAEDRGPRGLLARPGTRVGLYTTGETRPLGEIPWDPRSVRSGGWVEHTVIADGPRIEHRVNGTRVTELLDQDGRQVRDAGVVAFRLEPNSEITIRDVRLVASGLADDHDRAVVSRLRPRDPEWIWGSDSARAGERLIFTRTLEIPGSVTRATATFTADNHFEARLGGQVIARGDDWQAPVRIAIDPSLFEKTSRLQILARNDDGPAALAARVRVELERGETLEWVTDSSWHCRSPEDSDGKVNHAVHSFGPTSSPSGPWRVSLEEREATPADRIRVPTGFTVERLRSAQVGEGSWVALTFDGRGRLIISPQSGPLFRWEAGPSGQAGASDGSLVRLDLPIGSAQGLLVVDDDLYATVNQGNEPGLYRARDRDGDGDYDECERLAAFGGAGEHGPHGLRLGPDGWIYTVHGNMTELPRSLAEGSPLRHYGEDLLATREWDPRGHAHGVLAPAGRVLRTDRDGRNWQLFAGGMRNAYDIAFGPEGELFTFDSDMEWDLGLPWYRPTRVLHVVSGGEYGWRSGSGKWPEHWLDALPAIADVGEGSPTGLEFGTGSHFPSPYRDALFIADWTFGRILAVGLEPDGASFRASVEPFIEGPGLCVTDLEFGPDGALYFITGGRGTQSGLYRVRADRPWPRATRSAATLTAMGTTDPTIQLRRRLEVEHTRDDPIDLDWIWPHLGHADRFVRFAARVAIEARDPVHWETRALTEPRPRHRSTALLALARVGNDTARRSILESLVVTPPTGRDALALDEELRVIAVTLARLDTELPDALRKQLARRALEQWESATANPALQRELGGILTHCRAGAVGALAARALRDAPTATEQLAWAMLVRHHLDAISPEDRVHFFEVVRTLRRSDAGMSYRGYVDAIARAGLAQLAEAERASFEAFLKSADAPRPDFTALPSYEREWKLEDLLPHLDRVSSGRSFDSGRRAFESALCLACHRFDGQGSSVGPDLTAAAKRFSRRDLLVATLLPSEAVSDQYQHTRFTLDDGRELSGRVLRESATEVRYTADPLGLEEATLDVSRIVNRAPDPVSPMPARLLDALAIDEILDLLAYIESGGDPDWPGFE